MAIEKLKQAVSNKGIQEEIEKAREKLTLLEKDARAESREAIVRQMLQLDVCEDILEDFFLIP